MAYTLSWHMQGSRANQGHNNRAPQSTGNKASQGRGNRAHGGIDSARSGDNRVLCHRPIREVYKELFSESVAEFNEKQRNRDRRIDDYYTKVDKSKKHVAYEIIVQIGSAKEGFPENAADVLSDYYDLFKERYCRPPGDKYYSGFEVIGAYIHMDEATPHLHLDVIPCAKCERGMRYQNTLSGALKAQDFVTKNSQDTAQMRFSQAERDFIRELCGEHNIELNAQGTDRKRRYLEVEEYKAAMDSVTDMNRQITDMNRQISGLDKQIWQRSTKSAELEKKIAGFNAVIDGQASSASRAQKKAAQAQNALREAHELIDREQVPKPVMELSIVLNKLGESFPKAYKAAMREIDDFNQEYGMHWQREDWQENEELEL